MCWFGCQAQVVHTDEPCFSHQTLDPTGRGSAVTWQPTGYDDVPDDTDKGPRQATTWQVDAGLAGIHNGRSENKEFDATPSTSMLLSLVTGNPMIVFLFAPVCPCQRQHQKTLLTKHRTS